MKTQGSNKFVIWAAEKLLNNWRKETLFVVFAPIYKDFGNSIFFPYKVQSLMKSTQSPTPLYGIYY